MSSKRERKKREQSRRRIRPSAAPSARAAALDLAESIRAEAAAAGAKVLSRNHASWDSNPETDAARDNLDSPNPAASLAAVTLDLTLQIIQRSPHNGRHACRAGCAFCCHTAVTISPPEAIAMLSHLRAHTAPEALADVSNRLNENAAKAAAMSRAEYVASNIRCALLTDDGNCRVHPVRPLACAGFLSMSREACEAEFKRLYGRPEVPVDRHAMLGGMSASYGLKDACEAAGLDGDFYELHHALRAIWDRPDAAAEWAAGASLFDDCVRAEEW